MTAPLDVIVLGGGPAGTSAALSLRRHGRSVVVLERARYGAFRVGETFGEELQSLLGSVGAWEAASAVEGAPFQGVHSAWGEPSLATRYAFEHPIGRGWHVDRGRFDQALAEAARAAGAAVREGASGARPSREGDLWCVRLPEGDTLRARALLDATGRGAAGVRSAVEGVRWVPFDRSVAVLGRVKAPPSTLALGLMLEAVEEGWWYTSPQPDGSLLVTLLTDSDLGVPGARSGLEARWRRALALAPHTESRAAGRPLLEPLRSVRADVGRLTADRGPGWWALGDASLACDPLSGDGVVRAVRQGLAVGDEVHAFLSGEASLPSTLGERFEVYLAKRARYYTLEGRWPDSLYWARRRAGEVSRATVTLDPYTPVRVGPHASQALARARVEAWVPPRALTALLASLNAPRAAYEAMLALRSLSPSTDARSLLGLQAALASGVLR